jgi:hypothetical protein
MNPVSEQSEITDPVQPDTIAVEPQTEALKLQVEDVVQPIEAMEQQSMEMAPTEPKLALVSEDDVLQSALDQAASSEALAIETSTDLGLTANYDRWLNAKLRESRDWLGKANRDNVSIQVLMRSKSAARELVYYLRNEWPLDLSETYLYEVNTEDRSIYRVFFSEFDSLSRGRNQLELLPESVKVNSPYLHSVYRMQKALL